MQLLFNILATLFTLFLSLVWSKKSFSDLFIKVSLIIISFIGIILILEYFGYIVKI